jgi:hypothetical protein
MMVAVYNPSATKLESIAIPVPDGHFMPQSLVKNIFYNSPADIICSPNCMLHIKHETQAFDVSFIKLQMDKSIDLYAPLKPVSSSHV